jgi:predicted DNA-binding antitoxin AbrB/MazE fold protein
MDRGGDIPATYTNGVLRPDQRLDLPEGARVTVAVRNGQPTEESRARAWSFLERVRREGLVRLRAGRWSRDDLHDRR